MSQLLLLNPRRRRRKSASGKRRRRGARRKMTAKQLKFFGPRRTRRSRRRAAIMANPVRRLRRRSRRARRSFRRNPISAALSAPRLGFSPNAIIKSASNAAVGAAGAVGVDIAMGQAARVLPAALSARYGADGTMQPGYYLTKAALAIALGVIGSKFLPGSLRGYAARAAEGSLTVQAYELARAMLPPQLFTLGYYNAARVVGFPGGSAGNGLSRMRGMRAYLPRAAGNAGGMAGMRGSPSFASVGGSARNFEGYSL